MQTTSHRASCHSAAGNSAGFRPPFPEEHVWGSGRPTGIMLKCWREQIAYAVIDMQLQQAAGF